MKADGRTGDSYYGKLLSTKVHFEAQGRLAWICERAQGSTILDIGCSQGIVSLLLARAGKKVIGIDVDRDAIEYARKELTAESDSTRELITLIHGDALQQAFEHHSFDTVIINKSIEYAMEPEAVLDLARTICKPNGKVIITVPYGLPDHPDYESIFYLYRFAVLVSNFYKFKELDVIGKYIAFLGEPKENEDTGISETPLLDQEWQRRIHQLSELEFQQLEIRHQISLMAHSSRIRALQNKIVDYKADKHLLQITIESLENRIENLKRNKQALQETAARLRIEHSAKIVAIRASVTFQVGEALVSAMRPSKSTIGLPLRLWRIYRNYKSKKPKT
jgi:ubiquinone/menaquinone biosynthesis C-methylase UbiE